MNHTKTDENAEVSSTLTTNTYNKPVILEGIMNNMLDGLLEKEETVRSAIQNSLIKIIINRPLDATTILLNYKIKHPKLSEDMKLTLLKIIAFVINPNTTMPTDAHNNLILIALEDITHTTDPSNAIQEHAAIILINIGGTGDCNLVMEAILNHTKQIIPAHFRLIQCAGTIASTNTTGIASFIKPLLTTIVGNLNSIKHDHVKYAYAYAIGRLCDALLEETTLNELEGKTSAPERVEESNEENEEQNVSSQQVNGDSNRDECSELICLAYDILYNQWLNSREPKVYIEVLRTLSSIFPLLVREKIQDITGRLIPQILNLYRRIADRNSITEFLHAVLKANILKQTSALDSVVDQTITQLFDLVCVYPDYEKPHTIKGHSEVLRCFYLLYKAYPDKVMDTLLIHLRSNSERDRTKSLLILTHLLNTSTTQIERKLYYFIELLKHMIISEKTIKSKMTLLKLIVALAQKSYIKEKEFVWFIVRHSCKYNKINQDHGSLEEHTNFALSCENSLFMLSSTLGTMDEVLKRELLNFFTLLDYTSICGSIAKCLANLFEKSPNIEYEICDNEDADENNKTKKPADAYESKGMPVSVIKGGKIIIPSAEIIYTRCLALLGNPECIKRSTSILSFLSHYYPHLNPELASLWTQNIPDMLLHINQKDIFGEKLNKFIYDTNALLQSYEQQFPERLVQTMSDQMIMYPLTIPQHEFEIPNMQHERGMLLRAMGLTVCHVQDPNIVNDSIDIILTAAKQERLEKHSKLSEYEVKIAPCLSALGYISRVHLDSITNKLMQLTCMGGRKSTTSFFSNLNFIKDTHKMLENSKINLLAIRVIGRIMEEADPQLSIIKLDDVIMNFLLMQLHEKDQTIMAAVLRTLLNICHQMLQLKKYTAAPMKYRKQIMDAVFGINFEMPYDDLPLMPIIFQLGTNFIRLGNEANSVSDDGSIDGGQQMMVHGSQIFETACKNFFTCAQYLKVKFESLREDEHNSFLAKYLNESLPHLNALAEVIIQLDPSPSTLDLIIAILECWTYDTNAEVRVCASHVFNHTLEVYIKTMKIGCESPCKFNQTGQILAKVIPCCLDSNGTVRQVSVDILQKTLEIACIYETLTIASPATDWIKSIELIKEHIITEDPERIKQLANDLADIIALRISNFQYVQFCTTIMQNLQDLEQSSAIGATIVLNCFMQTKGSELFHAITDLVKEALQAIKNCENKAVKTGVLQTLVSLTKHHPKLLTSEMLAQPVPLTDYMVEFWCLICTEPQLAGEIMDNFLQLLISTTPYEFSETNTEKNSYKFVNPHMIVIFCALHEMITCKEIIEELNKRFPKLFAILLVYLSSYINTPISTNMPKASNPPASTAGIITNSTKSKFTLLHTMKDENILNASQIIYETFESLFRTLDMQEFAKLFDENKNLPASIDLKQYLEFQAGLAADLAKQIDLHSNVMKGVVIELNKFVSSSSDNQRIAAIGFFSCLVPLAPCGDISTIIMTSLIGSLSDPNAIVRGLSIQAMGFIGQLVESDIHTYTDSAVNALLKGIDDSVNECLINIHLESMRGLSNLLQTIPIQRPQAFYISLAIRIRPFLTSYNLEMRETAIILFSSICDLKMGLEIGPNTSQSINDTNEALHEQLFAYLFPLLLHLSETEQRIVKACKWALCKVCDLLASEKAKEMTQAYLSDHNELLYEDFTIDFVKLIATEFKDYVQDFIESCLPHLRSQWPEVRGNACLIIGILNNFLAQHTFPTESVAQKIAALLQDNNITVRAKAATALSHFFGGL